MSLRLGVVGVGHMGRIHAGKLREMHDVTVTGVVDVNAECMDELSSKHGIPAFCEYDRLFGAVEAVVIATPTETHARVAREFLSRGVHVFMEKPITAHVEEAYELIELAEKNGAILQIGHLERFSPAFRKAQPLIKNPLFIEAERVSTFTGRSTDVDVVLDLMIHDIDLTLSIAEGEVGEIRAQGAPVVTDKIDVAFARVEFTGGCVANLTANRVARKRERTFGIFQKDRYFSLDLMKGKTAITTRGPGGEIEIEEFEAVHMDPVRDELLDFITAIREQRRPAVAGEHGLRALVLANQIREQIERYIAERKANGLL